MKKTTLLLILIVLNTFIYSCASDENGGTTEPTENRLVKSVKVNDNFKSDYIMAKPQLETIIAASVAESFSDVLGVVEQALKIDGVILQLPFEEEDIDV